MELFSFVPGNIWLFTLLLSLVIQTVFFTFAATFKTDKVTDLSYGLSFISLAWLTLGQQPQPQPLQWLVVGMVTGWGLRLITYLFIRILKIKKDDRFDGIRENFWKFLQFWILQGVSVWVIMLPAVWIISSTQPLSPSIIEILGFIIWTAALSLETAADWQKFTFKLNPQNKDKWIETGVWNLSRHPNYFGEMMCWWGIWLMTVPSLGWPSEQNWSWLVITGPLFITYILLYLTGVPPLENRYNQRYATDKNYQVYKQRTNLLIPWWPKTSALPSSS